VKQYGSIDFKKQQQSGLSIIEWLFLEQIHFTSASKQSRSMNGWVMVNAKEYAEFLGVSDRTIRNHIRLLIDTGWIDQDEVTKMLRCSEKYIEINTVTTTKKEIESDKTDEETTRKNFPTTENNSSVIFPTSENFSKNTENFSTPIHYEYEEIEKEITPTPNGSGPASKSKKPSLIISSASSDPLNFDSQIVQSFIDHRTEIKKPMTQNALNLFISKLQKLVLEGYDVQAVVDDAIMNGWQSIYPDQKHKQSATAARGMFSPKVAAGMDAMNGWLQDKQGQKHA